MVGIGRVLWWELEEHSKSWKSAAGVESVQWEWKECGGSWKSVVEVG